VTVTYKPTEDWTVFGALKRGYKSGSYDISTPAQPGVDNSFGDEKVEGYEVGVKSRLLDRRLLMNLAWYDYRYTGLQVGGIIAQQGLPVITTVNAGSSLVYGIDFDASWRPEQVEGLGLNLSANWNEAHFKTLDNAPCAGGQLISEGCNLLPDANGVFHAQNLAGEPLIRAPKWQVNFGFDYERDIGAGMSLVVSNTNQYSSRYNTNLNIVLYQKAFIKPDLSITLRGPKDRWEVALIGKNLTNKITAGFCSDFNAANGTVLGGQGTGTNTPGPAGHDELACYSEPGRELWVRLTFKPKN
jgi:iron complex outermembrane receptor protein